MIRFRNPGTQYATHIHIIKQLYQRVGEQAYFTLEDMAIAIAQAKLMTAYGYSGEEAIKLSKTEQESMNSTLMNVKMYAEPITIIHPIPWCLHILDFILRCLRQTVPVYMNSLSLESPIPHSSMIICATTNRLDSSSVH